MECVAARPQFREVETIPGFGRLQVQQGAVAASPPWIARAFARGARARTSKGTVPIRTTRTTTMHGQRAQDGDTPNLALLGTRAADRG